VSPNIGFVVTPGHCTSSSASIADQRCISGESLWNRGMDAERDFLVTFVLPSCPSCERF
jgi:hypothetical protein